MERDDGMGAYCMQHLSTPSSFGTHTLKSPYINTHPSSMIHLHQYYRARRDEKSVSRTRSTAAWSMPREMDKSEWEASVSPFCLCRSKPRVEPKSFSPEFVVLEQYRVELNSLCLTTSAQRAAALHANHLPVAKAPPEKRKESITSQTQCISYLP
ncbi:hypothetical protein KQX54_016868 [Cotesia glomerata]|uniref:Uncharacterized protein n=1 Tax=Cotesia glomerata TaxID=32391 RepID=A0AAV7HY66_COTGL|nr:hypothetical protein KQX54_016868 [Cotesia glomerata]